MLQPLLQGCSTAGSCASHSAPALARTSAMHAADYPWLNSFKNTPCASVSYIPLHQLVTMCKGSRLYTQEYLQQHLGTYPVITAQTTQQGIAGYCDTYAYDGEFVTWSIVGTYAGTCFYRQGKFSAQQSCGVMQVRDATQLDTRYLCYLLQLLAPCARTEHSSIPMCNISNLENLLIPVPPLTLQHEIATQLQQFERLLDAGRDSLQHLAQLQRQQWHHYLEWCMDWATASSPEV